MVLACVVSIDQGLELEKLGDHIHELRVIEKLLLSLGLALLYDLTVECDLPKGYTSLIMRLKLVHNVHVSSVGTISLIEDKVINRDCMLLNVVYLVKIAGLDHEV